MASKNALEAMQHGAWIIVTEMLDKGKLSTEDINKQHDMVNMVVNIQGFNLVNILDLFAIVLTV